MMIYPSNIIKKIYNTLSYEKIKKLNYKAILYCQDKQTETSPFS